MAPSSSGLGHQVLILKTGVRLPVGSPRNKIRPSMGGFYFAREAAKSNTQYDNQTSAQMLASSTGVEYIVDTPRGVTKIFPGLVRNRRVDFFLL